MNIITEVWPTGWVRILRAVSAHSAGEDTLVDMNIRSVVPRYDQHDERGCFLTLRQN